VAKSKDTMCSCIICQERLVIWAACALAEWFQSHDCPECRQGAGLHKSGCPLMPALLGITLFQKTDPDNRTADALNRSNGSEDDVAKANGCIRKGRVMARDLKYGKITTERGEFPREDEPVFVLRGKDVLALETLRHYCEQARRFGCSGDFLRETSSAVDRFAEWGGHRRLPD